MTPAKIAVQEATLTRLQNNLSTTVGTDPGVPGLEIGDDDEIRVSENTNSVHTDVVHTHRARAFTEKKAKEIGRDAAEQLTDRNDPLSLSSPFNLLKSDVQSLEHLRQRDVRGEDVFIDILIVTHRISRS